MGNLTLDALAGGVFDRLSGHCIGEFDFFVDHEKIKCSRVCPGWMGTLELIDTLVFLYK